MLYQISRKRINAALPYRFELRNSLTLACVLVAFGRSPVAPKWLRLRQHKLNQTFTLEDMSHA
jgi:hypothetical protein